MHKNGPIFCLNHRLDEGFSETVLRHSLPGSPLLVNACEGGGGGGGGNSHSEQVLEFMYV